MARVELLLKTSVVPSRKVLLKAMSFAKAIQGSIHILGKDYHRSEDHTFLDFLSSADGQRKRLSDNYLQWTGQVLDKVEQIAKEEGIEYNLDFHRLEGRQWMKQLLGALVDGANLLLIDQNNIRVTTDLLATLANADRNVLILSDKSWTHAGTMLAAIDPLHREDKAGKVDESVIELGELVGRALNMDVKLVYCRYIAGYLSEYKDQILASQKEGVMDFVADRRLQRLPLIFARGNPEAALPEVVKAHKAAMLVMGACRRGSMSRFLMGSTVDALLKNPPCDLLLVTSPQL
ncbi:universal stress protein [Vibrio variabilis]|uniref:universal stress protein n=1 Tax=Vibrio variabilis TaxID=990271 RepID=UPI000DD67E74|nr:universal stress protein [Vibrio variabilis]